MNAGIPSFPSFVGSNLLRGYSLLPENARLIFCSLETFFYSRLKPIAGDTNSLTASINRLALNNFSALQGIFSFINGLSTIFVAKELLDIFGNFKPQAICRSYFQPLTRWRVSFWDAVRSDFFDCLCADYVSAAVLAASLIASSFFLAYPLMKNQPEINTVKTKLQKFAAAVQLTHIFSSLALVIYSQNKASAFLSASLNAYSLIKNSNINWMVNSQSQDVNSGFLGLNRITKLEIDFWTLFMGKPDNVEPCAICLKREGVVQVFCTKGHTVHSNCLHDYIDTHSEKFFKDNRFTKTETRHHNNGHYSHSSHSYSVTTPKANLPTCPNCHETPQHHELWFNIHDKSYDSAGEYSTKAKIV